MNYLLHYQKKKKIVKSNKTKCYMNKGDLTLHRFVLIYIYSIRRVRRYLQVEYILTEPHMNTHDEV